MAKWFGKIGYITQVQTKPGVWKPVETVYEYFGDVERKYSGWRINSESTNDDLTMDVQVSIVADQYAYQHFSRMKWIELYDAKWKITKIEPKHPRLILSVGGVYNG
jgi:hypothetical protein